MQVLSYGLDHTKDIGSFQMTKSAFVAAVGSTSNQPNLAVGSTSNQPILEDISKNFRNFLVALQNQKFIIEN